MEASFGANFADVEAYVDQGQALGPLHTKAATQGNSILFTDTNPDPAIVAHELTHIVQNRQAGSTAVQALANISAPEADAEHEAGANANACIQGLPVQVNAAPAAAVMRHGEYQNAQPDDRSIVDNALLFEKQEKFELALGAWLENHPLALQGANLLVDGINDLINSYIADLGGDAYEDMIVKTFGRAAPKGTPGAVKNSFKSLIKAMQTGNLRQKMTMVYNAIAGGMLPDMLDNVRYYLKNPLDGSVANSEKVLNTDYLTSPGMDTRMAEADAVSTDPVEQAQNRRYGLFDRSPLVTERGKDRAPRSNEGIQAVNQKEQQTVEQMEQAGRAPLTYRELKTQFDPPKSKDKTPDSAWKKMSQDQKKQEILAENPAKPVPWHVGYSNYELQVNTKLTEESKKLGVRLLSGVSGSTDMYMHVAKYLNIPVKGMELVRLATLGEMLSRKDHSFYEIMLAAAQYGVPYTPGNLAYHEISPLKEADIKAGVKQPFPDEPQGAADAPRKDSLTLDLGSARTAFTKFFGDIKAACSASDDATAQDLHHEWETRLVNEVLKWMIDPQISALVPQIKQYLQQVPAVGAYQRSDATRRAQVDAKFATNPDRNAMGAPALIASDTQFKDWLAYDWVFQSNLAVQDQRQMQPYIDLGIPRVLIETAGNQVLDGLDYLKQWLEDPTNAIDTPNMQQWWDWLKQNNIPSYHLIMATMIRKLRGDTELVLVDGYMELADAAKLMTANADKIVGGQNIKILSQPDLHNLPQPPHVKVNEDVFAAKTDRREKNLNTASTLAKLRKYLRDTAGKLEEEKDNILQAINQTERAGYEHWAKEVGAQEFVEANIKHTQFAKDMVGQFDTLDPRERGSIFQYTTTMYSPMNHSMNNQDASDYMPDDAQNRAMNPGGVATLKFTLPMLKAMTSGLEMLPVYAGDAWRGAETGEGLHNKPLVERQDGAQRFGFQVGAIISYSYTLSTSKSIDASYLTRKNECDYGYRIIDIKTGRDVELLSNSEEEEEVLFPPGSRFVITAVDCDYDVNNQKKILITMKEL